MKLTSGLEKVSTKALLKKIGSVLVPENCRFDEMSQLKAFSIYQELKISRFFYCESPSTIRNSLIEVLTEVIKLIVLEKNYFENQNKSNDNFGIFWHIRIQSKEQITWFLWIFFSNLKTVGSDFDLKNPVSSLEEN